MKRENLESANKINNELKSLERQYKEFKEKDRSIAGYKWSLQAGGYSQVMPIDLWSGLNTFTENWFKERLVKLENQLRELK